MVLQSRVRTAPRVQKKATGVVLPWLRFRTKGRTKHQEEHKDLREGRNRQKREKLKTLTKSDLKKKKRIKMIKREDLSKMVDRKLQSHFHVEETKMGGIPPEEADFEEERCM